MPLVPQWDRASSINNYSTACKRQKTSYVNEKRSNVVAPTQLTDESLLVASSVLMQLSNFSSRRLFARRFENQIWKCRNIYGWKRNNVKCKLVIHRAGKKRCHANIGLWTHGLENVINIMWPWSCDHVTHGDK